MHFPDLEVGCDWSTFFTFRFSRNAPQTPKCVRVGGYLSHKLSCTFEVKRSKNFLLLAFNSILLFKKNICISDLLKILVCDMVAMLLSSFPNIKIFGIHTYSQKLNMFDWQNFFHELEIKQQAGIGFPVKSIHPALYIRINSCN